MTTHKRMTLTVKESTMVRPVKDTPNHSLWISNLDRVAFSLHMPTVYFYRKRSCYTHPTATESFFGADILKESLSKALVPFYPLAGRFRRDKDDRIEINCNGEGVLFVEVESSWSVDDFGDFLTSLELSRLVPSVDCSDGIDSYPLLVLQVTYFKCGGISLGAGIHHTVVDGASALHFINAWTEVARGLDIAMPPFIDRTLLRSRDPPLPSFDHIEYLPFQPMKPLLETKRFPTSTFHDNTSRSVFKFSRAQVDALKAYALMEDDNNVKYTSFEVLIGHVWRCACIARARGLVEDQETKLCTIVDGRARLRPCLPPAYFGNGVCPTLAVAISGDLVRNPLWYSASKVHESLARIDNDYLRSMLDYLEMQPELPDASEFLRGTESSKCLNFLVTTWARLPIYDADFGWGKPIYMGPCFPTLASGSIFILPSPTNDESLSFLISLPSDEMELFARRFYEI